jgi:Carboxypeptidase regulatory-like domain
MTRLRNVVVSAVLLVSCSSAGADTKSIVGTVIDTDGKPFIGAGVSAERLDAKGNPQVTKTIAKGQYVFTNLPIGVYQVLVTVKGAAKSRAKIKTRGDGWVRVDFDLRGPANVRNVSAKPSASPANSIDADAVSRMQRSLGGNINGMSFPGH